MTLDCLLQPREGLWMAPTVEVGCDRWSARRHHLFIRGSGNEDNIIGYQDRIRHGDRTPGGGRSVTDPDADVHREALEHLADAGDDRVIPHLLKLEMIDAISSSWSQFGFSEVLRERLPPRYLELPEASWPGVEAALAAVADPDFNSEHAWVEWESWYSHRASSHSPGSTIGSSDRTVLSSHLQVDC